MKWTMIFMLMISAGMVSCQQSSQTAEDTSSEKQFIKEVVSVERFAELMNAASNKQLIDVRTPEEFAAGHLEGAVNINFFDEDFEDQIKKLDRNKTVFVYCKSGGRSGKASNKMQALEFETVYDMAGGYTAWSAKNK